MRTLLLSIALGLGTLIPFSGVAAASPFESLDEAEVEYLAEAGVLEVALDGSTELANNVTRAELVKLVVEYVFPDEVIDERCLEGLDISRLPGINYELLFRDVSKDAPYALHLCIAMRTGMIWGYGDGMFLPHREVNLAEASKIISIGFNLDYKMPEYQTDTWYLTYIRTLQRHATIPRTIDGPADKVSQAEAQDVLRDVNASVAAHSEKLFAERLEREQKAKAYLAASQ